MSTTPSFLDRPAPDFDLADTCGRRHALADWRGRWGLLVFLRHLSCLLCRAHLDRLRAERAAFAALGVQVAAVTFESLDKARPYAEELQLEPWPLLLDTDRTVYDAYGMVRGGWWQILQPANWVGYGQLFWQGYAPRVPALGTDVFQLGGDVIIDPQGVIRLHDCSEPAARLAPETLLAAIRDAAGSERPVTDG